MKRGESNRESGVSLVELLFFVACLGGGGWTARLAYQQIGWPGVPLGFVLGVLSLPVLFCILAVVYVRLFPERTRR